MPVGIHIMLSSRSNCRHKLILFGYRIVNLYVFPVHLQLWNEEMGTYPPPFKNNYPNNRVFIAIRIVVAAADVLTPSFTSFHKSIARLVSLLCTLSLNSEILAAASSLMDGSSPEMAPFNSSKSLTTASFSKLLCTVAFSPTAECEMFVGPLK